MKITQFGCNKQCDILSFKKKPRQPTEEKKKIHNHWPERFLKKPIHHLESMCHE